MGVTFSIIFQSSTLPNGLVAPGEVPIESYGFAPTDTNSFGASASVTATLVGDQIATPIVTFPAIGAPDATITCSPFQLTSAGGIEATAAGSILCNQANTLIAPGTVSVRFIAPSTSTGFDGLETITTTDLEGTSVFVIATAASTSISATTTTTQQTLAEFTSTLVAPSSTEYYTPTTTLTGASSTKYADCSSSASAPSSSSVATSSASASWSHSYDGHHGPSSVPATLSKSYTRSYGDHEPSASPSKGGDYDPSHGNHGSSSVPSKSGDYAAPSKSSKAGDNHGYEPSQAPTRGPLPGDDTDGDYDYNHGPKPSATSSRTHGYGGSCRRKHRSSSAAAPSVTEHAYYRRDAGYGPPALTFDGVVKTTTTTIITVSPSILLGQTTILTTTSGVTTITVTTSTVTSDLRTVTTVNTCSASPSASTSSLW